MRFLPRITLCNIVAPPILARFGRTPPKRATTFVAASVDQTEARNDILGCVVDQTEARRDRLTGDHVFGLATVEQGRNCRSA
jgi:hypothetical protein